MNIEPYKVCKQLKDPRNLSVKIEYNDIMRIYNPVHAGYKAYHRVRERNHGEEEMNLNSHTSL